jgi:hypothetical protein
MTSVDCRSLYALQLALAGEGDEEPRDARRLCQCYSVKITFTGRWIRLSLERTTAGVLCSSAAAALTPNIIIRPFPANCDIRKLSFFK